MQEEQEKERKERERKKERVGVRVGARKREREEEDEAKDAARHAGEDTEVQGKGEHSGCVIGRPAGDNIPHIHTRFGIPKPITHTRTPNKARFAPTWRMHVQHGWIGRRCAGDRVSMHHGCNGKCR